MKGSCKKSDQWPGNFFIKRLLLKLSAYGIDGALHKWICSFLSNRRQRVVFGDYCSDWSEVKSGVPQGSVLGPTLFILYINDLPDSISSIAKIYADDTKILAKLKANSYESDTAKLQNDIDNLVDWTNIWLMRLNIEKCKVIHVGNEIVEKNIQW